MPISPQTYGDISPRTSAFAVAKLLKRGDAKVVLEKLGQVYELPTKSSKFAKFRRYEALDLATTPLQEGVSPTGKKPVVTDYTAEVEQFGDFIPFTDVIEDTIEDPVMAQYNSLLDQQVTETVETLRYNVVKAGTNVYYANGTARTDVNSVITLDVQRKATAALINQRAQYFTEMMISNANYRTEPIEAAFVAVAHVNVGNDIRNMDGFISTKLYAGGTTKYANELGTVEDVRYVRSVLFTPFADGGGAKGTMRSTSGTSADVYPVLYFAKDAFGIVPLKGKSSMSIMVVNPKPASGDPLGQRGTIGWKLWHAAVILNQLWLVRVEVAATA